MELLRQGEGRRETEIDAGSPCCGIHQPATIVSALITEPHCCPPLSCAEGDPPRERSILQELRVGRPDPPIQRLGVRGNQAKNKQAVKRRVKFNWRETVESLPARCHFPTLASSSARLKCVRVRRRFCRATAIVMANLGRKILKRLLRIAPHEYVHPLQTETILPRLRKSVPNNGRVRWLLRNYGIYYVLLEGLTDESRGRTSLVSPPAFLVCFAGSVYVVVVVSSEVSTQLLNPSNSSHCLVTA